MSATGEEDVPLPATRPSSTSAIGDVRTWAMQDGGAATWALVYIGDVLATEIAAGLNAIADAIRGR